MMKVFRDEYGQASSMPGAGLHLFLRDFACETLTAHLPNDSLLVDAATLTRILHEAEEEEFARVKQLEDKLNYPRNLAPSPRAVVPVARSPKERRRRIRPVLNNNDEQSLSEASTQSPLEALTDEGHGGYNQCEGPA
jgi:hypothetical protein